MQMICQDIGTGQAIPIHPVASVSIAGDGKREKKEVPKELLARWWVFFLPEKWRNFFSSGEVELVPLTLEKGIACASEGKRVFERIFVFVLLMKTVERAIISPLNREKITTSEAMRCEWAMPYRNGQTVSKRKHGVYFSKFGFFSTLLFSLCCLEAWSSLGMCSACPRNCSCSTVVGLQNSSVVNCSNKGLERGPSDLPSDTNIL